MRMRHFRWEVNVLKCAAGILTATCCEALEHLLSDALPEALLTLIAMLILYLALYTGVVGSSKAP